MKPINRSKRWLKWGQASRLMRRGGTLPSMMSIHCSAAILETLAIASCVPACAVVTKTRAERRGGFFLAGTHPEAFGFCPSQEGIEFLNRLS